jgi:predicted nucleic acid-binding Zn finger protein
MKTLRFSSPQEEAANRYISENRIKIDSNVKADTLEIRGKINDKDFKYNTLAVLDKDNRLIEGSCECSFYKSNQLRKGPCEHILATRMALQAKVAT